MTTQDPAYDALLVMLWLADRNLLPNYRFNTATIIDPDTGEALALSAQGRATAMETVARYGYDPAAMTTAQGGELMGKLRQRVKEAQPS